MAEVPDEAIGIADEAGEAFGPAALAGGASMSAGIPGEDGEIVEGELVARRLKSAGVFVAAVEEDEGFARRACREPGAVDTNGCRPKW